MDRKIRHYEGEGIVVSFEAKRCIHEQECVHGLPSVFDAQARPWIQPESSSPDVIAAVVRRCPTGALQYRRTDGGPAEVAPAENTVRLVPDGPLRVAGDVRLHLSDGEAREELRVSLCRCGASQNKPFCDNSHREMNFKDSGAVADDGLAATLEGDERSLHVRFAANGPILIKGPVRVIAANDRSAEGEKAALCRCGESATKPYCDGTHVKIDFVAD